MHEPIDGTDKQVRRSGTQTSQVSLLKRVMVSRSSRQVTWWFGESQSYPEQCGTVFRQFHRSHIDKVERFPLSLA